MMTLPEPRQEPDRGHTMSRTQILLGLVLGAWVWTQGAPVAFGRQGGVGDVPRPPQPQVKPVFEGPLHEAFLSPVRDSDPQFVAKAPPPPVVERPGVDR